MNVLIVDDEPIAQDIIKTFCVRIPYLNVMQCCDNAIDAIQVIDNQYPDIVFLDIQMPEMSGLELLKALRKSPSLFVLTTAFPQYALEGYELNIIDYLLKPIPFERFIQAVNKCRELHQLRSQQLHQQTSLKEKTEQGKSTIWVKEGKKLVQISLEDIVLVKALKDYMDIFMLNDRVIVHITMAKLEEYLTAPEFLRVSRSCIVRKSAIRTIQDLQIETILPKMERISIGPTYWESVKTHFKEWF